MMSEYSDTQRSHTYEIQIAGQERLRVSEVALGTMTFGDEWGWGSPKDEAQKSL